MNAGEANTCAELQQDVEYVDEVWTSIGTSEHPYTGTFNGNGHTIRVWLDGWGQALFGYVGADAKLTDIAVTKRQSENYSLNASAPLARINDGTITHCWYRGAITAKGSLGGLVYTNNGTIEACYVYAGELGGSRIEMYYGGWAGGIAYENTGTIANSYFYGDIAQAQSGGTVQDIIGWGAITHKNSGTVSNCYYGADSDDGYGGKTKDQFRGGEVTYLLNGGTARDDWRQNRYAGDDTPVLDRSHAQVRKSGDYYVSLYPHVHCICGGGTTSGGHPQHSDVTYTAWTDDEAASQYGASSYTAANSLPKKPGKYYLTSDVTLRDTGTWRPADGTVLCLNGQTVREFAFDTPAYDAITVGSGVTFSLTECASIQGYIYCASSRAVHTVNNSGTFNFYNGRLRDTKSKADGAAVYNTGTFNMYGGTINDNNTTARGGGVYNAGACNLYGGTITNNGTGGGVYNNGTLTVGGTATVTGNSPNVYLAGGTTITLNSELDESARIGITAEKQSDLTDTADITVVKGGAAALNCFFPDDDGTYDLSDASGSSDIILHLIRDHTHCACAHKAKYAKDIGSHTEHVDHEFVAWTDALVKEQYGSDTTRTAATAMPKVAGCYYLTDDVTLGGSSAWTPVNGTIICMNGHKVTSPSAIGSTVYIESNVHVVLTDCKASGSISNTRSNGAAGLSSRNSFNYTNSENCTIDLFGVTVSGTGRSVANYTGSTVNLYNSTVSGTKYAIYNTGTVNTAGTVKTTSDTVESGYYCVYNFGTLTVDGTLTANGGDVGIYNAANKDGSQHGTMTVNGIVTSTGSSNGLSNGGVLAVTGTLTAIGKNLHGLYNNEHGTLTVNGTLTAAGNASSNKANGLYNAGGTVTVNGTLTASGGQYSVYNYGTLNLSGTVNANKNVYLGKDRTITVVGELDNATSIPVQTSATPAAGSPVTIATTENANWIKAGSFVSWTPSKYAVSRTDEGKTVVLRGHEHDWSYTLGSDGTAISAECGNADGLCGNTNGGSVTIAPPSGELIYDGSSKAAKLTTTGWTAADVGEIVYQKDGSALSAVPVDAGTYTAGITVGGQTASVTYEIGKATPMAKDFVFAAPGNLNYDGNSKIVTVSSTKISVDDVTVKYYDKDGEEAEPKNAGDYIVKIDVAESTNYAAAKGLTADGWKFTIAKNTTTPDVTLSGDMVYKKNKIEPTVTVTVDGKTLTKDKDYEVTYGDNMNAGKNAGTVTITAKGNYDFAQIVKMFDITAQIIQVTAENKSSRVGQDIVELTYTHADGLPYEGDTFSGKLETTADKDKAGTYGITKGTLTLGSNYNIVFTPGTYTVEDKLPQDSFAFKDVVDGKVTKTYGDADFTVAVTGAATGSTVTYASTDMSVVTVDAETGKVHIMSAGTTTIKATAHETKDYTEKEISYTLTVAPKTLTKDDLTYSGPITKVYDGSNSAPRGLTVSVKPDSLVGDDTLAVNGTLKYNSANVSEADTITFTPDAITEGNYRLAAAEVLTITGASITKATPTYKKPTGVTAKYGQTLADVTLPDGWSWMDSKESVGDASAAAKPFKAKFTPMDTANYNTVKNIELEVTVNQADGGSLGTVDLTQKYMDASEHTYTPDWAGLPAGQDWTFSSEASIVLPKQDFAADGNLLTYAISGGKVGDKITITLKASCNNYEDFTITLNITLTEKDNQQALRITGGETVVYGQTLQLGTSGGNGNGAVTYAVTNGTGEATIDATGKLTPVKVGKVKVSATKAGDASYNSITSAEVEITITRATPTGEPAYTKITASGKTLADAGLTTAGSTLNPNAGTLVWVDNAGNVLPATTTVEANTTYKWLFTPTDTNYTTLTGSIELYHKSSSGGGGWYYTYHTIKATAGANGSISPSGWTSVREGWDQTFTITPDKGYAVAKVLVDGKSVGAVKSYTFKNVTKDHTIEAIFMKSNGNPQTGVFVDVAEGSYYEEAIDWAVEKGITNGVSSNMFAPNDPCTRAQIVTFLWRAASSPAPKSMSSFTDVPADAFYAKAVAWAVENGITSGTGEGKFSPNSTCTRAQAVTFLYRASGSPAVSGSAEFSDVATNAYYADAVAWATKKGITTGIGGGLFGSDNDCTRGQIVTFLWRAMAE